MGMKKSDKSVTLMDVAKRAGVGVGTASRVLNKDPRVKSPRSRQCIRLWPT